MNKRPLFPFFPNLERDCTWESPVDEDGVQVSSHLDRDGREIPDSIPIAPPVGMTERPSLADFVHRMIRQEVSKVAAENEMESFDEADDFDIEDDPLDEMTPYEKVFDPHKPGDDWPMYYNPKTGLYGQLPPDQKAPDGFVQLEREKKLPPGFTLPSLPEARSGGNGGGRGGSSTQQDPPQPPDATDTGGQIPPKPSS